MPAALFLDAAIAFLRRYKAFALAIPLLFALALSHCSDKRHTRQRDEARAVNVALIDAAKKNAAAAVAQVKAVEAKYTIAAKENDRAEQTLRRDLGALAAANADRMRADKVCRSYAAAPSQGPTAPVDHGPGPDAIILERRDYDTLIENTLRLEAVHQWGEGLVKDGLAVPAVVF